MTLNIYLCCGLGGRFVDDDTITIDVDPKVRPHIVADVRHLPLRPDLKPKKLLMTPPCTFFTYARPYPRPGIGKAFEILGACFEAVNYLKPETWILENPRNHLQRIIGKPKFGIRWKAFDTTATHLFYSNMKSLKRAKFPPEITQYLLGP
jgi:hypothetical protein